MGRPAFSPGPGAMPPPLMSALAYPQLSTSARGGLLLHTLPALVKIYRLPHLRATGPLRRFTLIHFKTSDLDSSRSLDKKRAKIGAESKYQRVFFKTMGTGLED